MNKNPAVLNENISGPNMVEKMTAQTQPGHPNRGKTKIDVKYLHAKGIFTDGIYKTSLINTEIFNIILYTIFYLP